MSEATKSVNLNVRIWYDPEQGIIRLASSDGHDLITTVNGEAKNARGHPNLFNKLAKCLRDAGKPAPPEAPEPSADA